MGHRSSVTLFEFACWTIGVALIGLYASIRTDAAVNGARDLGDFQKSVQPDTALWSSSRRKLYRSSPQPAPDALVGALVIRALDLEAPLYSDTSELHLNRGVGLIARTAAPGAIGNLGIAGHRDGLFRLLKDIDIGVTIEVLTRDRSYRYRVSHIEIVERSDASLLQATAQPVVTLVTCHPFYFVGSAPRRFVVRADLESSHPV